MELLAVNAYVFIIGGAAIFSVLVFFIILFILLHQRRQRKNLTEKQNLKTQFQEELLKTQLETQEETFHQIGEELHDNIGQLLSSTRMLMGIAERSLHDVPDTLRTADQTLAKAIQDLRMLSKSLNREWLSQFNVVDNLKIEIERINTSRTIYIQLESKIRSVPLAPESQVMLFRIIQEALQNCIKHASAAHVNIGISMDDALHVSVKDDGKGFDDAVQQQGVGLMNMKHRTHLLGGNITWKHQNPNGTEVVINLPFQN